MPAILDSIRRGQRIAHYETVRIAKDRRRLDVFLSVSPVHEEGRIVGAASIARDNTEHKRLEERSRLYTKGLELIHEMDRKILQHASGRECAQFVIRHLVAMAHLSRVTITSLRIGKAEQG